MAIDISINAPDAYIWCATYHNDVQTPEYDHERPDGRGFAEVDNAQVKALELWPVLLSPENQQMIPPHRVNVPNGATPVFFRRRKIIMNPNTNQQDLVTTHCIGWKSDTDACYLFVFDDGSTMLSKDLQAV